MKLPGTWSVQLDCALKCRLNLFKKLFAKTRVPGSAFFFAKDPLRIIRDWRVRTGAINIWSKSIVRQDHYQRDDRLTRVCDTEFARRIRLSDCSSGWIFWIEFQLAFYWQCCLIPVQNSQRKREQFVLGLYSLECLSMFSAKSYKAEREWLRIGKV